MSLSIRSVVVWAIGFLSGRYVHQLEQQGPSDFELQHLSEELSFTRASLQAVADCETELRTEIRHSTTLSVSFRSVLGLELLAGLLCVGIFYYRSRISRLVELTDRVTVESPVETPSSAQTGSPSVQRATREGPIRPSDLRR